MAHSHGQKVKRWDLFSKSSSFPRTSGIGELNTGMGALEKTWPSAPPENKVSRSCRYGSFSVLVECSHFNFRSVAKRALFCQDELVGPDQLFLETGC